MASYRSVANVFSSASQSLRDVVQWGWTKARRAASRTRSASEATIASLFSAGGAYFYPAGWAQDKREQARRYRLWFYIGARAICEEYARSQVQVAYRKGQSAPIAKRLVKSHTPLQPQEELELVGSDHPLMRLLSDPNEPQVAYNFRYQEMLASCLCGEAYIWKVRNSIPGPRGRLPAELWPIFPQWVEPRAGTTKLVESYLVRPASIGSSGAQGFEIPAEDMIPILDPSPLSLVRGWSPLQATSEWYDVAESIDASKWHLFENGVWPSMLLEMDSDAFGKEGPDYSALKRIRDSWREQTKGRDKHGEPIILRPGLKSVSMSRTPAEMDFQASGDIARDQVLASLRVGKTIAGITEEVNRASSETALHNFLQRTMGPKLIHRGQIYTEYLARDFHPDLTVFWPPPSTDDPDQINASIETARKNLAITPNEVRQMQGREPFEFGGNNPIGQDGQPLPWADKDEIVPDEYGEWPGEGGLEEGADDDMEEGADESEGDFSWMEDESNNRLKKAFDEAKRKRGQPENRGQFGSANGSSNGHASQDATEPKKAPEHGMLKRAWKKFQGALVKQYADLEGFYGRPTAMAIVGVAALPLPGTAMAPLAAKLIAGAVRHLTAGQSVAEKALAPHDWTEAVEFIQQLWADACLATGEASPEIDEEMIREALAEKMGGKDNDDSDDDSDDPYRIGKDFNPNQKRGQPKNRGQFGPGGAATKVKASHPGTTHGSSVRVRPTKMRAFAGEPAVLKTTLTKQETGRLGEAIVIAYLKQQGFGDAKPMNSTKTNFPIDLLEDHAPTEVKAGLASNSRKAQQWRLTFSKESAKEKTAYEQMTPEEKAEWNTKKQKRIHERKQKVIEALQKEFPGVEIRPRTVTAIINSDTRTADIYVFDGFHDRIDWQSSQAKQAYKGSLKYG